MYLDNVLLYSEIYDDHLHHLNIVFKKFQKPVLKLSSVNVNFSIFQNSLTLLGS